MGVGQSQTQCIYGRTLWHTNGDHYLRVVILQAQLDSLVPEAADNQIKDIRSLSSLKICLYPAQLNALFTSKITIMAYYKRRL